MSFGALCLLLLLLLVAVLAASEPVRSQSAAEAQIAEKADVDSNGGGGATATAVADVEKTRPHSASPALPHGAHVSGSSDLDLDLGRALFGSAVVFSGFALAVALVWLGAPLFGYKLCAILGNCGADAGVGGVLGGGGGGGSGSGSGIGIGGGGNGEDSVIVNGGEDASPFFPFSVGFRHNQPYGGYRKRSLKYVGPLLRTLSSAYETYEEAATTTTTTTTPKIE